MPIGTPFCIAARRDRERAQVEEVHEVRVRAERGVERVRFGGDLFERVDRGRGRHDEHRRAREHRQRLGAQVAHPVLRAERVGGGEPPAAVDDRVRDLEQRAGVRLREVADRGRPFGHERIVVEHAGGLVTRAHVDRYRRSAERCEARDGLLEAALGFRVAAKHALFDRRHGEREAFRDRLGPGRARA